MAQALVQKALRQLCSRLWLCVVPLLFFCACAATPTPDASGPRPNEPRYPVAFVENADRRQATLAAWERLLAEQGITNAPAPELQPVTASLRSLPALPNAGLYLPKVGDPNAKDQQSWEEATTESLRRFINSNARLFGAEAQQLSLVLLTDAADGTKKAKYQQRPFTNYPLANGFGQLEIAFTNDRRILQITSTCIPDIDQLRRAGAGIRPRYTADEVARRLNNRAFSYTDAAGNPQSYTIQASDSITIRQLVIYPILRSDQTAALDFHLAWEVVVNREPKRAIYLDAITDEILAVTPIE